MVPLGARAKSRPLGFASMRFFQALRQSANADPTLHKPCKENQSVASGMTTWSLAISAAWLRGPEVWSDVYQDQICCKQVVGSGYQPRKGSGDAKRPFFASQALGPAFGELPCAGGKREVAELTSRSVLQLSRYEVARRCLPFLCTGRLSCHLSFCRSSFPTGMRACLHPETFRSGPLADRSRRRRRDSPVR